MMSRDSSTHTPGPWLAKGDEVHWKPRPDIASVLIARFAGGSDPETLANVTIASASPTLADALKGMIGLCQLVRSRDDIPPEARQALTHNHRIIAAYEALSAAGIEGFQPADFDAHKVMEAQP